MRRTTIVRHAAIGMSIFMLAVQFLWPSAVSAHQSPGTCNSNRLNVGISKDKTEVQQGDILNYEISSSNANAAGAEACDFTNVEINVTLPAADGTPTGTVVNIVTGVDYPAGTPVSIIATIPYTVNVDAGVHDIVAQVTATGTLHDAPSDHTASILKTIGTSVIVPTNNVTPPSGNSSSPPSKVVSLPRMPKTSIPSVFGTEY